MEKSPTQPDFSLKPAEKNSSEMKKMLEKRVKCPVCNSQKSCRDGI